MIRVRLLPALGTVAALIGAWVVWRAAPPLIALLGLGRFELLARVLLVFGALGVAERAIAFVSARYFSGQNGPSKESSDDH